MGEDGDIASLFLEKTEKHLGNRFLDLFQKFPNEYGPQGIVNLQFLAGIEDLYGEYSEMKPYLRNMNIAAERGLHSASSIGGGLLNALFIKKMMVHQTGVITDQQEKKGGFLGFGGGGDEKKKQEQDGMKMFK